MRVTDKIMGIRRAVAMLVIAVGFVSGSHAFWMPDPEVEVDGITYRADYINSPYNYEDCGSYDILYDSRYCLENARKLRIIETAEICEARNTYYIEKFHSKVFEFYDGSEIPAFEYVTRVVRPNISEEEQPSYDAGKDKMSERDFHYTGDVWLQDSVLMPALPDLRKKKYYIVCDIEAGLFNEELTSIRTPRYAVIREDAFKDCTGLRTARIGAAQHVENYSFENCTNLETVIFESLPEVRGHAFFNCPNIKTVVVEGGPILEYPSGPYYVPFDKNVYKQATLYVKKELINDFRRHKSWGRFLNIRDIEEYYLSGVGSVSADTQEEYQIYNVSGVLVRRAADGQDWREGLPSGVYIVKSSLGTVRKEYVGL